MAAEPSPASPPERLCGTVECCHDSDSPDGRPCCHRLGELHCCYTVVEKDQLRQLELDAGRSRARDGMSRALQAAAPGWAARAEQAVRDLAATSEPFTADDVRERAGDPGHRGAMGALLNRCSSAGLIRPVGYAKSTRAERRSSRMLRWVGTQTKSNGGD